MKVTKEEIEAAMTAKGGYTRATLAKWGVPWPPVQGWKERLINGELPQSIQSTPGAAKGPKEGQLDLF
jgi:hypothetical protein